MTTKPDRWSVALLAGGWWLLTDVLRMWTPSLITVFGQAAETPPELIGAFALACCAAPVVLVTLLPRTHAWERIALVCLVLARLGLVLTDGGTPQLVVSSIGTVAGLWWFALACGRGAPRLVPGLAWGLLLATTSHAALGTYSAVWRRDVGGVVEAALAVGLIVTALVKSRSSVPEVAESLGRRAAWLVLPVLMLCGVVFANAGRASAMAGLAGVLACVAGTALAVALSGVRAGRVATAVAGLGLVALTALATLIPATYDGMATVRPWAQVPVFLLGTPAAMVVLGAAISPLPRGRGGPAAVAGGGVLWVVLLFVYYAGYDLGYRADVVLVAVAAAAVVAALTVPVDRRPASSYRPRLAVVGGLSAAALVLAAAGPWLTLRPVTDQREAGERLRVVSYNVRMGYGGDGRFEAREVARLLAREQADVVLLSEVDRGWLLNGGQDQLLILARLLDMHAAFGPAADQVWGDAILSTEPLHQVESHALDAYGAVTGAQALSATTTWRGRSFTVISTHLQPGEGGTDDAVGQCAELADLMRASLADDRVVVAGGDLNTTPGSEGWQEVEEAGYVDALADARPLFTARAEDPDEEIDHVFVSPGIRSSDPRVVDTQLSDHLPVIVDLEPPPSVG